MKRYGITIVILLLSLRAANGQQTARDCRVDGNTSGDIEPEFL